MRSLPTLFTALLAMGTTTAMAVAADLVPYPVGYRDWAHVKSMVIGPGHPLFDSFGGLHHLYANEKALQGYRAGRFPDGSVIVFDLLSAVSADNAVTEGPRKVLGVMHKDAVRYAATGGWGGRRILDRDSPTMAQDFKANVLLGANGSSREQPFRAARLALSDRLADVNAGFLRPGARLAVFFLTDEDDCSGASGTSVDANADCRAPATKQAEPPLLDLPGELAAFLLGPVDGELRDVVVGAIAGFDPVTLVPSCGSTTTCPGNNACATAADKADRFADLRAALGGARMRLASICDAQFRDTLTGFGEVLMPSTMPLRGAARSMSLGSAISCTRAFAARTAGSAIRS